MKQKKKLEGPAITIAYANHKGGVAKTTTTITTASLLSQQGYKVLCVDLDAQANLTFSLFREDAEYTSIADKILTEDPLQVYNILDTFDLVPSSLGLSPIEMQMITQLRGDGILADKLEPLKSEYDFILIDCPPALGMLTINALAASDYAVIPLCPEILPWKGLISIIKMIDMVTQKINTKLICAGILLTNYDGNKNLTKNVDMAVRKVYGPLVFDTHIRKNVKVAEAPAERQFLTHYAPNSPAVADYKNYLKELLKRINDLQAKKFLKEEDE